MVWVCPVSRRAVLAAPVVDSLVFRAMHWPEGAAAAGTPVVSLPLEPIGQGPAVPARSAGVPPAVWESMPPVHP